MASPAEGHVVVDSMPAITVDPPVGGATEAKQDAQLAKLPDLVGGRIPVVLPAGGGGLTDAELRAQAVPVSGAFYPVTQPVSGTFWQTTQPVSGTFWQATQPVSLAASVAVTGTFWQATQPVSGPLTDVQIRATALPVSGTFWQATQPVSGPATDAQLRATPLPVSGTVSVNVGLTDAQLRATSVPVQVKDSGRVRCLFIFRAVAPATADTLLTLTRSLDSTETTGTTFAVTAAKRLRITAVAFSLRAGAAAAAFATMTLRTLKGNVLIGSPGILRLDLGNTAATIGGSAQATVPLPDGLEFSGTDQIGVSLAAQAVTNIISITLLGHEYTP